MTGQPCTGRAMFKRAAHLEIFPLVVEHMHLLGVEIDAAVDVTDEGVVGETVPQPGDHVVELARPVVALVMLHLLVEAEIQRRVGVRGGDDVPAGAAAAEMVERGEAPGDVIGRVESGRGGGDEADMLGRARERREERERLEGGHRVAALQGLDRHVEHRQMVGHEEGVELARLQLLRQALQQREVEVRVRRRPDSARPRYGC